MIAWYHQPTIFRKRLVLQIAGILAICVVLITTIFLGVAAHAASGVNQTLSFEGRLLKADGSVVADGYYNIQFKIYEGGDGQETGDTGGTLDWTESYVNNGGTAGVKVVNGFFSVNLGSQTPFANSVNWNNDTLWLSMNVAGSSSSCTTFGTSPCTADGEMTPMNRITSSPYAMNSGELNGLGSNDFLQVGQGVQTDASNGSSLALNKTGTGDFIDLQNAGTSVFNVDNSGNINLGGDSDKTISVGDAANSSGGSKLTVSAGSGSSGGNLILQGGNANGSDNSAIAFEGSSNGSQAGNTVTFTAPNNIAVGDLLIAYVRTDGAAAAAASGWTEDQTISGTFVETRYHKYATNADVAGTTYSFTGPGNYAWGEMAQLRPGVTPADPSADPFAVSGGSTGSGNASVALASTPQSGILLGWGAELGTDTGFSFNSSPSVSFTKVGDTNGSALSWASTATSTAYTVNVTAPDSSAALMTGIVTNASISGTSSSNADTFPHTPILDTFNRANGEDLGASWNNGAGNTSPLTITSNALATTSAQSLGFALYNTPFSGGNGEVYITVATPPAAANDIYLYMLDENTGNYYELAIEPESNGETIWHVHVNQAGSDSIIISNESAPVLMPGDKVGLERLADGTVSIWYDPNGGNWTLLGTTSNTALDITGFVPGVGIKDDSNTRLDDFGSGSFTPSVGGNSDTTSTTGGNVIIKSGAGSGSGAAGNITLQGGNNSQVIIDNSGVTIGHTGGGSTTTLNLDNGSSAPTGNVLGSMYYDTTLGEVQCYEASGWGDCSNSPNQFVSLSPTYANAVVHATGTGTLTTDMCSDALNINDGSSSQPTVCGTNETYNYYDWTTDQTSAQTRSIFVTYQLPSNFKGFASGSTSLKARTDSSNATASYKVYRNDGSGLTECGSAVTASTGSQTTWQTGTATGSADPASCSFNAGDSIVFEIDLASKSSANAYVSNLNFTLK